MFTKQEKKLNEIRGNLHLFVLRTFHFFFCWEKLLLLIRMSLCNLRLTAFFLLNNCVIHCLCINKTRSSQVMLRAYLECLKLHCIICGKISLQPSCRSALMHADTFLYILQTIGWSVSRRIPRHQAVCTITVCFTWLCIHICTDNFLLKSCLLVHLLSVAEAKKKTFKTLFAAISFYCLSTRS